MRQRRRRWQNERERPRTPLTFRTRRKDFLIDFDSHFSQFVSYHTYRLFFMNLKLVKPEAGVFEIGSAPKR